MKELQLIDRVVVEIKDADVDDCTNEYVASVLRGIADQIVNGRNGGRYSPDEGFEALWEHECPNYGGFRMGNKSLICMHYYGSEPKPKKYIIIAHNYDRENSSAYPVGGMFASRESAEAYLRDYIEEIKSNHWTATRVDGKDHYTEGFTCAGWEAEDMCDGSSLELEIHEMEEML